MKLTDLETKNYSLVWGTLQGAGTYIIIDKRTDKSTLRNTGSEGVEHYKKLKRMYNKSKNLFDDYIAVNETFTGK